MNNISRLLCLAAINRTHLSSIVVSLVNSGPSSPDYWSLTSAIRFYYASKLYYSYTCETHANRENTQLASWGTYQRVWSASCFHLKIRLGYYRVQNLSTTICCFGFPRLLNIEVDCKKGAPVLIWHGKRCLALEAHEPTITSQQPWLYEVFTVPPHSRRIPGGMDANSMWIPWIPYGILLAESPAILV